MMELNPVLQKAYTADNLSAHEAQLRAQFIAWGPAVFQATRVMWKWGILEMLRQSDEGLTREEIAIAEDFEDGFSGMIAEYRYFNRNYDNIVKNVDEDYTSQEALENLNHLGRQSRALAQKDGRLDSLSACYILERYYLRSL